MSKTQFTFSWPKNMTTYSNSLIVKEIQINKSEIPLCTHQIGKEVRKRTLSLVADGHVMMHCLVKNL